MDDSAAPAASTPSSGRVALWVAGAVVLAAIAALFVPRREADRAPRPGGFLVDASGRAVPLAAELEPATLVHFWATWCPPCRTELPELVRFAREPGGAPKVLFVAVGDDVAAAREFLAADDLRLLFDPAWEVANRFRTGRLPETHLVVNGEVVRTFVGATAWGDAAVRAEVQKWTASPASAAP
ncbi:MAG: TlpA family protein disulfide reductase [Thermoanaerobaculia bacterium]|nr:TlpA family protein disulfide reductase [Thermoanaerobaculia bacterium]